MRLYFVISLCLTALVVLFSAQNSQSVQITFIRWYLEGPLVVILLTTFVLGMLVAWLASFPGRLKRMRELAECRRGLQEKGTGANAV